MKAVLLIGLLAVSPLMAVSANARGCLKGAVVGGVAGHMAGHGALGAAAGCAVGRHEANQEQRDRDRYYRDPRDRGYH